MSQATAKAFAQDIEAALAAVADPARVVPMTAYMKNQFQFLGVPTPLRRATIKPLVQSLKGTSAEHLLDCARALFASPYRECHYAACGVLRAHIQTLNLSHLPVLYALVQTHSWWDSVDSLAPNIGRIVRAEQAAGQVMMDALITHDNMWMRRVALIHQLGWRGDTDTARLYRYALALGHEKEFFIRKAIGWALRDYARHDAEGVRAFLQKHRNDLAPLSVREAGKHLKMD